MPLVRIEMFRNGAWQVRQQGEADIIAEALAELLAAYAIQFPHHAYLNGRLVAERKPVNIIARRN